MSNPKALPTIVDAIHRKGNTWTLWIARKPSSKKTALRRNNAAARLSPPPIVIPRTHV